MPSKLKKAALYWFAAYWIVTILGILLTILFAAIFQPPTPEQLGVPVTQAPAYLSTLPYHPVLNLLVWPIFAWCYLRPLLPDADVRREGLRLGLFWSVGTILVDLVGWVMIPHPWRMTLKEFYVDYQPWITLIYLIILMSPILAAPVTRSRTATDPRQR